MKSKLPIHATPNSLEQRRFSLERPQEHPVSRRGELPPGVWWTLLAVVAALGFVLYLDAQNLGPSFPSAGAGLLLMALAAFIALWSLIHRWVTRNQVGEASLEPQWGTEERLFEERESYRKEQLQRDLTLHRDRLQAYQEERDRRTQFIDAVKLFTPQAGFAEKAGALAQLEDLAQSVPDDRVKTVRFLLSLLREADRPEWTERDRLENLWQSQLRESLNRLLSLDMVLRRTGFTGLRLAGLRLEAFDLEHCDFSDADLYGCHLANSRNVDLTGAWNEPLSWPQTPFIDPSGSLVESGREPHPAVQDVDIVFSREEEHREF